MRRIQASLDTPALLDQLTARADLVVSLTALCTRRCTTPARWRLIDASYTDLVPLPSCARAGKWLIHLSTCEVYGRVGAGRRRAPMDRMHESDTGLFLAPCTRALSYAAAKQLLERVIWALGTHAVWRSRW